jgi:pyruvate ferredoxin oxidoreductase gamma subunit
MKTASRMLGTAFFLEGFEVQDAPRYGAERRGAPIFAYVRASREPVNERGVIARPDLVIVADHSLVPVPAAGVLAGVDEHTVMLINSDESPDLWKQRLNTGAQILSLPVEEDDREALRYVGAACAGAAARLVGVISRASLEKAVAEELGELGSPMIEKNQARALVAYDVMKQYSGNVNMRGEVSPTDYEAPDWIELPFDEARISAPAIHATATSIEVKTGLWRTHRPVIDHDRCNRCWWVCSTFCPDSAINVDNEGRPSIDYDHCKGCMICVAQCPPHAITAVEEEAAQALETQS